MATETKKPIIAFMLDERINRERSRLLTRVSNALRTFATVDLISGNATENEFLERMKSKESQLVLLPWYRYLQWKRVEAFYGLSRTSGPTVAGYFSDGVRPVDLGEQPDHQRAILFDFSSLSPAEATILVRSLLYDKRRSGIRPFFSQKVPIYCENWYGRQGHGSRVETILALPELHRPVWTPRFNAIRITLLSMWSLIYEEGPGKGEIAEALSSKSPRAYLQVAADDLRLVLRLCFQMPNWTPKDTLNAFWPDASRPTHPGQLLLNYSDFLRVHRIAESPNVELVAGYFPSASAEKAPGKANSLWIEPLAPQLLTEAPFEAPGPHAPELRPLPVTPGEAPRVRAAEPLASERSKDQILVDAIKKIRALKQSLAEKEELIADLRSGGVSTAKPLPLPDGDALLEAFQERYFEAKYQIRQLELQISAMESGGTTPEKIDEVRGKIAKLTQLEKTWIDRILKILEEYRGARKPG